MSPNGVRGDFAHKRSTIQITQIVISIIYGEWETEQKNIHILPESNLKSDLTSLMCKLWKMSFLGLLTAVYAF